MSSLVKFTHGGLDCIDGETPVDYWNGPVISGETVDFRIECQWTPDRGAYFTLLGDMEEVTPEQLRDIHRVVGEMIAATATSITH